MSCELPCFGGRQSNKRDLRNKYCLRVSTDNFDLTNSALRLRHVDVPFDRYQYIYRCTLVLTRHHINAEQNQCEM